MKKSSQWYLQPTRQSAVAMIMIVYNVVKAIIRGWWPLIVVALFRSDRYDKTTVIWGLTALGVLIILAATLHYWKFFFYVDRKQLHVEKGVLRRSKIDIPFDRIQSISLQQPWLHRLLGVSQVKIDTAGSSGEEFNFNALSLTRAADLKEFLQAQIRGDGRLPTDQTALPPAQEIMRLSVADLLRIGVSQNHFRTAGILLFFAFGLADQIEEAWGDYFVDRLKALGSIIAANAWLMGSVMALGLLLIAFVGTLARTIFRYYDFVLSKKQHGYLVASGLLNRYEQVVSDSKVQFLRWSSNPLKDYFKIVTLRFYQASSEILSSKKAITVPGCHLHQLESIVDEHFQDIDLKPSYLLKISRKLFLRRWFFLGWLPFIFLLSLFIINGQLPYLMLGCLWLALSYVLQDRYQRSWQAWASGSAVSTAAGVLERHSHLLKTFKIQGVKLYRTPYLRRNGLATIILYTASGRLRIPYVELPEAQLFRDLTLQQIETHRGSWM